MKLSITARWDFEVVDEQIFIEYVRGRLIADRGYSSSAAEAHTSDAERALMSLFELDGEMPEYKTSILKDAGSGFNVTPVEKTLYDMGDDERIESGF